MNSKALIVPLVGCCFLNSLSYVWSRENSKYEFIQTIETIKTTDILTNNKYPKILDLGSHTYETFSSQERHLGNLCENIVSKIADSETVPLLLQEIKNNSKYSIYVSLYENQNYLAFRNIQKTLSKIHKLEHNYINPKKNTFYSKVVIKNEINFPLTLFINRYLVGTMVSFQKDTQNNLQTH